MEKLIPVGKLKSESRIYDDILFHIFKSIAYLNSLPDDDNGPAHFRLETFFKETCTYVSHRADLNVIKEPGKVILQTSGVPNGSEPRTLITVIDSYIPITI